MFLKLLFSFLFINYINCNSIKIQTTVGTVEGQTVDVLNQTIYEFLGIPFAEPPVGSLRFAKPKPIVKAIEGVIDATKPKYSCIQPFDERMSDFMGNITINEDCLVLNIWTAKDQEYNNSTKLKPVMFWIYGGGLSIGSIFQPQYNGSALATQDVVFVSTNYRLGALGFMYADETVPGNQGLYDQRLALEWVRENIHLFGGDKNQITIFGESAGSWSVSTHLISPLSHGLFKRAIMQSGANLFNKDRPIMSKEEALTQAKQTATQLNCTDDREWLQCLRRVDAKYLVSPVVGNTLYFPIAGTEFLPLSTQKAFSEHKFNKDLDLMTGVTKDEGSTLAFYGYPAIFSKPLTEHSFREFIANRDHIFHNLNATKITDFYLKDVSKNSSDAIKWKIYDFYGDLYLKCPTYFFAKQYAERSSSQTNVFFYELTHQSKGKAYEDQFGIYHGADIDYVFGLPLIKPKTYSIKDIEFSKEVMKYWTDFAKYGKPDSWKWQKLINSGEGETITKDLDPKYKNRYFGDHFKHSCEDFWHNYYLDH